MKVIEFLGMPRASKTTQMRKLAERFKQQGINYNIFQKPEELINQAKNLEELNMTLYESLFKHYESIDAEKTDCLIYYRGFYDRIALSTADYQKGALTKKFKEKLTEDLERRLEIIDFPLLLLVNPKISLERRANQLKENLQGHSIERIDIPKDINWLQHLFEVYVNLKEKYPEIHVINAERKKEDVQQEIITILKFIDELDVSDKFKSKLRK